MNGIDVDVPEFLLTGFLIKFHLAKYLGLSLEELDNSLPKGSDVLATIHPGSSFKSEDVTGFYEEKVGTAHLLELAAWHLSSADYIADTLRLQKMFARGTQCLPPVGTPLLSK